MHVTLMADYSSDGVWNARGAGMDRDALPIPENLKEDIARWCLDYEESEFFLDPEDRARPFDAASFDARGEDLARRLRAALPCWTVVHRGAARHA
jgi:hypothetical protein